MKDQLLDRRFYSVIFLIALATITIQIVFSRIFSVTLYYHAAFAGITCAMLGLTAGALRVYLKPGRFSAANAAHELTKSAIRFSTYLVLATLLYIYLPGSVLLYSVDLSQSYETTISLLFIFMIVGGGVVFLYAFIHSGICISLLLTRFPNYANKLYAFDLVGAALGCIVVVLGLKFIDPIGMLLLIALLIALCAWRLLSENSPRSLQREVKFITLLIAALSVIQIGSYTAGAPWIRIIWAKQLVYATPPLFERWNTYSRVAVTNYGNEPFGWGYSRIPQTEIEQKFLNIDAQAGTVITAFDGDTNKIAYLKNDIINLGYHIRDINDVAVIGVGGGRDVLSALTFGAKRIKGIELNPSIFEALTQKFADFSGHLHQHQEVSLVNAEARSYLNSHPDAFDLIQISLIDTWAATAAGGLTLSENQLYTTDAWEDFFNRLTENGMLTVSRWYEPDMHPGEYYRLLAIASDVLKSRDPSAVPQEHILAAHVNKVLTIAISKSPFTAADIARFKNTTNALDFEPLVIPGETPSDPIAARIASGTADKAYFHSLPLDVAASTDDKPFFFYMLRLDDVRNTILHAGKAHENSHNNLAIITLFGLLIFVLAATLTLIVPPMKSIYRKHQIRLAATSPFIAYFAAIGLGFMLVEISQMQRLMIFLGHPIYALTVVLFTLLLASGIGSYCQQRLNPRITHYLPLFLCIVMVATGLLTPLFTEQLKHYDNTTRIIVSALLIAPMGFFMGMMFPIGVKLIKAQQEDLLPWYWGINGGASVFASVFAVVFSLQYGISTIFWLGAACYIVCMLIVWRHKQAVLS